MGSNTQLPFERLRGRENFSIWKVGVKAHLITKGLWSYTSLTINDDTKPEIIRNGEKALAKITLTVHSSLYSHVEDCTNAKDGWEALCKAFEDKGVVRKVALLKQWISLKLDNCNSMQEYVNQCLTLRSKVKSAGFNIDEEVAGAIMLCGLSDVYKPIVMGVEANGKSITVDYVKNILLQEIEFDKDCEKVLLIKKKTNYKKFKKQIKCYKCGGPHYQSNCPNKKSGAVLLSAFLNQQSCTEDWYIDSGATAHMISSQSHLENLSQPLQKEDTIRNMSRMQIKSCGTIKQKVLLNNKIDEIVLTNVNYLPELCANLLSVSHIVRRNYTVTFNKKGVKIINANKDVIATGTLIDDMFKLDISKNNSATTTIANSNSNSDDLRLWHRRLGHISVHNIKFCKNNFKNLFKCEICIKGKQTRLPFAHIGSRATQLLELIHSDVCGPISSPSFRGSRYFITVIDDLSRKVFVFILKNKNHAFQTFIEFKRFVEKQTGCQIKTLRTDNGTEYVNYKFNKFLQEEGIQHQKTAPYTPQQNGLAERMNRTLTDRIRCILDDANLPKSFWAEALITAAKIMNSVPCKGTGYLCPEEIWSGKQPDISNFRIFGCKAFAHVPQIKRKKLDPKAIECLFVGYAKDSKAYRLYNPSSKSIIISRDVTFIEKQFETDFEAREANETDIIFASPVNYTEENEIAEMNHQQGFDENVPLLTFWKIVAAMMKPFNLMRA